MRGALLGRRVPIARRGPLGIGEDFRIRPVWKSRRKTRTLALSATDSCRDRLAAFYYWNDRQALATAVAIAVHQRVTLARVREWSRAEGQSKTFAVFLAELARSRKAFRRRVAGRSERAKGTPSAR